MTSITWGRSAPMLTWGLALVIGGQVLFNLGQQAALQAALGPSLYSSDDGGPLRIIGAIVGLVGLIVVLMGVYQVASNVDLLTHAKVKELDVTDAAARKAAREAK